MAGAEPGGGVVRIAGGKRTGRTRTPTSCYLILQVQHGRFVRVYPSAAGSFDCKPSNTRTIGLTLSQ